MPKLLRPILLALILAASSLAAVGCGGSSGPDPSISAQEAAVLTSKIDEIKANVEVGSCLVAADKTNDLLADIADLPSSVNNDVKQALDNGANNLKLLLNDPDKCEGRSETTTTETTEPTTTEESTTERTQSTTKTTPTQTQTTPTQTQTTPTQTQTTPGGGASGGIGPGGL